MQPRDFDEWLFWDLEHAELVDDLAIRAFDFTLSNYLALKITQSAYISGHDLDFRDLRGRVHCLESGWLLFLLQPVVDIVALLETKFRKMVFFILAVFRVSCHQVYIKAFDFSWSYFFLNDSIVLKIDLIDFLVSSRLHQIVSEGLNLAGSADCSILLQNHSCLHSKSFK